MTRNMLASDGWGATAGASLIFRDFSKLSSKLSVVEAAAARFLAATRRSSSSSSFKSISIPFAQNASGTLIRSSQSQGHKISESRAGKSCTSELTVVVRIIAVDLVVVVRGRLVVLLVEAVQEL